MNISVPFYISDNIDRQSELDLALRLNLNNINIDNVLLFIDEKKAFEYVKQVFCEKLNLIFHYGDNSLYKSTNNNILIWLLKNRPTYNTVIKLSDVFKAQDEIQIILNSDCYLYEQDSKLLFDSLGSDQVYCLTRWNINKFDFTKDIMEDAVFYNHSDSQDCWIYKKTPELKFDFHFGIPGCDNKAAYIFKELGYEVLNPSKSIRLAHFHNSNIRTYAIKDRLKPPFLEIEPTYL